MYRSIDYTPRDHAIVDYALFSLPEVPDLQFRGPAPELVDGQYLTCLGAAQALGVLIDRPFPTLLGEALGVPVLNLGLGGVSASFLAAQEKLLARANRGRAVVLQVVSARAEPNDRFRSTDGIEMMHDTVEGDDVTTIVEWIRAFEDPRFEDYVEQCRRSWVTAYHRILDRLDVPVILFWFSPRSLESDLDLDADLGIQAIGGFPQLVDGALLEEIVDRCDGFVACHSERDFDFRYVDRHTGEPTSIDWGLLGDGPSGMEEKRNHYYPSQAMNDDALPGLLDALAQIGITPSG